VTLVKHRHRSNAGDSASFRVIWCMPEGLALKDASHHRLEAREVRGRVVRVEARLVKPLAEVSSEFKGVHLLRHRDSHNSVSGGSVGLVHLPPLSVAEVVVLHLEHLL